LQSIGQAMKRPLAQAITEIKNSALGERDIITFC
jgi:hypothetical protein